MKVRLARGSGGETPPRQPPGRRRYIGDRYGRDDFYSGNVNEKTEPLPNWLTTPIVPPWASTITLAIARPMPVPGAV